MNIYMGFMKSGLDKLASHEVSEQRIGLAVDAFKKRLLTESFLNLSGNFSVINTYFSEIALKKIFGDNELEKGINYLRLAIHTNIIYRHTKPIDYTVCAAGVRDVLYALLAGDQQLLHWHRQYTIPFMESIAGRMWHQKPYTYHHLCLMIRLAMQEDWRLLEHFCIQALSAEAKKNKLYKKDYEFLLALACKDVSNMQKQLLELLKPAVLFKRQGKKFDEWSRESYFMACYPMLYYKLAQLYGFELEVDDPWMQKNLLPRIESTVPAWGGVDIVTQFDIFQPFDDASGRYWCLNPSVFSPRSMANSPLTYREVYRLMCSEDIFSNQPNSEL